MPAETPKIDVQSLSFYYGAKRALEGITLQIHPHLVTAFIGPSGCGKSTFLRTLNRMRPRDVSRTRTGRMPSPDARRDCEVNLATRKQQLADQETREQQLRNQESELTNALSAEQARWSEFNARLDELERAIR